MKTKKRIVAKNSRELGKLLGLSDSDIALMEHKAELTSIAVESIKKSGMPVGEIVKASGVARSKVSAVKNGASVSVSCDLLVKIIAATGRELHLKAA